MASRESGFLYLSGAWLQDAGLAAKKRNKKPKPALVTVPWTARCTPVPRVPACFLEKRLDARRRVVFGGSVAL